jgi:hypothetical protein
MSRDEYIGQGLSPIVIFGTFCVERLLVLFSDLGQPVSPVATNSLDMRLCAQAR